MYFGKEKKHISMDIWSCGKQIKSWKKRFDTFVYVGEVYTYQIY